MGGHEISIFDFRTSLPINEILYIQYINTTDKLFISGEILSATTQNFWVFISFVQKIAIPHTKLDDEQFIPQNNNKKHNSTQKATR